MPRTRKTRKKTPYHKKKHMGGMWPFTSSSQPKTVVEAESLVAKKQAELSDAQQKLAVLKSKEAEAPSSEPVATEEVKPAEPVEPAATTEQQPVKKGWFFGGKKTKKRVVRK